MMVEDELDFKAINKGFNRFIFDTIWPSHSIPACCNALARDTSLVMAA